MPNMFGGDQFHPAYDPGVEVAPNQVMIGNRLYTAIKDGRAAWEDVDGQTGVAEIPEELKNKLEGQNSR